MLRLRYIDTEGIKMPRDTKTRQQQIAEVVEKRLDWEKVQYLRLWAAIISQRVTDAVLGEESVEAIVQQARLARLWQLIAERAAEGKC